MMLRSINKLFKSTTSIAKTIHFSDLELKQMISQPNELRDLMIEQIKTFGELKISEYWKQALTDERFGYYRHKNVFSTEGDFTTSPEISALFGQMIAIWIVTFLQTPKINIIHPSTKTIHKKFRIIEMGPGRGYLMQDILQTFRNFKIDNHFDLSFVEVSEFNKKEQQKNVMEELKKSRMYFKYEYQNENLKVQEFTSENQFKDINLRWYSSLEDILTQDYNNQKKGIEPPFTVFIMNQFFDALPVTLLEFTQDGWKEKVLKLSQNPEFKFELKNSEKQVPSLMLPSIVQPQIGDRVEISPESYLTMDLMAKMIKMGGGGILNIDYGGFGPYHDSIRAIKDHKYIKSPYFWELPGTYDLSAYVPFTALAQYAQKNEGVKAYNMISQQAFLQAMGIETRVQILIKKAKKAQAERIIGEIKRLTDALQMGEIYKVQIISLQEYGQIYPHISYDSNVY